MELIQSDEAGSIADLGLKPGGRVRMTQTSFIQIKQSIHMARLESKEKPSLGKNKMISFQRFNSSI